MLHLIPFLLLAQMPPLPATGTGIVVGRVIDQADQKPISGAAVTLFRVGEFQALSEQPRRQITDGLGRFVFRELPGGQYTLQAEFGGTGFSPNGFIQSGFGFRIGAYLDGGYGQRRPGGPLQPLILADGQALPDVVIQMWKGAAISGVVMDDTGEPVVDTVVGAAQLSSDGRLRNGPTVRTDDRGMYRLSALTPGRYIVFVPQTLTAMSAESADALMRRVVALKSAQDPAAVVPPSPELTGIRVGSSIVKTATSGMIDGNLMPRRDGDAVFAFQTTFYPAAVSLAAAAPIEVASGDDRSGIDVSMRPVRASSVSGTVYGGGAPAGGVRLRLVPTGGSPDASLFEAAIAQTDALGRFTFPLNAPALILALVLGLSGSASGAKQKGRPCTPPVAPIRGVRIKMVYKVTFNYQLKEEGESRLFVADSIHGALNDKGAEDRNTFVLADGVTPNFTVEVGISNDGTDHFIASGSLSGWGQGYISDISSGSNYYATPAAMFNGLAADIYKWIHGGWHDSRPECR